MANTRQLRINDNSKIRERIGEFAGKQITLVFNDGRTVTGKVDKTTAEAIVMLNMRNKTMSFPFTDIAELYFDTLD